MPPKCVLRVLQPLFWNRRQNLGDCARNSKSPSVNGGPNGILVFVLHSIAGLARYSYLFIACNPTFSRHFLWNIKCYVNTCSRSILSLPSFPSTLQLRRTAHFLHIAPCWVRPVWQPSALQARRGQRTQISRVKLWQDSLGIFGRAPSQGGSGCILGDHILFSCWKSQTQGILIHCDGFLCNDLEGKALLSMRSHFMSFRIWARNFQCTFMSQRFINKLCGELITPYDLRVQD